jgi:hypothetical protein
MRQRKECKWRPAPERRRARGVLHTSSVLAVKSLAPCLVHIVSTRSQPGHHLTGRFHLRRAANAMKTNVNRIRTKKWVTVKKLVYNGDGWDDYGEHDERGLKHELPLSTLVPVQRFCAGAGPDAQQTQRTSTDGSFADLHQHRPLGKACRNSFIRGR